ncbi:MAG: HNH endonuclease [Candidatus Heimdallarchaeaceae archaeon]
MLGLKRCPKWLKDAYRKAVNYTCEDCRKKEEKVGKLEPHRMIPGYKQGTYRPGNVKMLCKECHRNYAEDW